MQISFVASSWFNSRVRIGLRFWNPIAKCVVKTSVAFLQQIRGNVIKNGYDILEQFCKIWVSLHSTNHVYDITLAQNITQLCLNL